MSVNRIFAGVMVWCLLAPILTTIQPAIGDEPNSDGDPPATDKIESTATESPALPAERRLRFSFRHQRWIDVLEWLSEQSNLSLVLDAPPQGSFNYSDSREYTPLEAIDLVNGVLALKGYTLVRRDRMLTVVSLVDGVPRSLLPRVKLDELDDRGKFEMVSIAFPVGRRKIEEVLAEIQVLLGPYGKADPLVASGQILVSDRASIMRTIGAVIESIPEIKPPAKPAAAAKPEKPELGVYALGGRDSAATLGTLKALVGGIPIIYDSETDHINAYATPTQHNAIAQVLEQMKIGASTGNRIRLEVYPLPELDVAARASVLSNLALVAPDARLRYDEQAQRLFVWAKPALQETIRSSMVKLLQVTPAKGSRSLRVYTLQRTDPTTLSTLLQATLPQVWISVDTPGRRLIIHASEQDLQTASQLVEQMDAEPAENLRPVLRVYPVDRRLAERVTSLLMLMVPKAEVTVDSNLGRVSVVATPGDQLQVESLLTTLTEGVVDLPHPTVEVVKVPGELSERFEAIRSLLDAQIPNAQLLWDPKTLELTVWATAADHTRVGIFLDQMSRQPGRKPAKAIFEILKIPREMRARFDSIQTMLAAEIPKAKLTWDPKTLELTVWATTKEIARIREVLAQVAKQPAMEPVRPTLEVHTLSKSLRERFESIQSM
ncbi:MAG: secretin N-terminal domain-containing protein, partial [Pirellulales bacterium]